MNSLIFPLIFVNSYLGFQFLTSANLTFITHKKEKLFWLYSTVTYVFFLICKTYISINIAVYTPLLMGFFCFFTQQATKIHKKDLKLEHIVTVCEITSILMKTGRSFHDSLERSLDKIDGCGLKFCKIKKNVVMQQPKSRKSQLFIDFQGDLEQISHLTVGKRELLTSIKEKYTRLQGLKQKLKTSTTQYRAQSATLLFLWCSSLGNLIWQSKAWTNIRIVLISFTMMSVGLLLSRKILQKFDFQI